MKSFEIQLYRGGTWKTDSIYDDRALAEMEARRMEESPRYGNLRIIEEIFDEKTETTKLRTIYRDKGFQDKIAQKAENLRIKDKSVLKPIEGLVKRLYEGQVVDPVLYKDRIHSGRPEGKNYLKGGLGHVVKIDGYGTMAITTLMAMLAWELAEDCGVRLDQRYVDRAFECIRTHTNKSGYMGYRHARGAYSPVGRQGLSIIAHKLAGDKGTEEYVARVTKHLARSKTRLNDGHGDNVLAVLWGLLGIQLSGDQAAIREIFDYNKAFINMSRTHDGSFVAQPGRNSGDKGYYMSSRLHPTAAMVLVLGMSRPSLRIQGK